MVDDTEPIAERSSQKTCTRCCADQRKLRQIQADRARRRAFSDHDINRKILHRWVKNLLDLAVQAVDLINKQDVALLQIVKDRCHLTRFFDRRAARYLHMGSHLICNDARQRCFSKSRRAVKQHMIENITSLFCCFNIYFQVLFRLFLSDVVVQVLGTERTFDFHVLLENVSCDNSSFHRYKVSFFHNLGPSAKTYASMPLSAQPRCPCLR